MQTNCNSYIFSWGVTPGLRDMILKFTIVLLTRGVAVASIQLASPAYCCCSSHLCSPSLSHSEPLLFDSFHFSLFDSALTLLLHRDPIEPSSFQRTRMSMLRMMEILLLLTFRTAVQIHPLQKKTERGLSVLSQDVMLQ